MDLPLIHLGQASHENVEIGRSNHQWAVPVGWKNLEPGKLYRVTDYDTGYTWEFQVYPKLVGWQFADWRAFTPRGRSEPIAFRDSFLTSGWERIL